MVPDSVEKTLDPATHPEPDGFGFALNGVASPETEKAMFDSPAFWHESKFHPVQVLHAVSVPRSH
jgi:hypothetical protein